MTGRVMARPAGGRVASHEYPAPNRTEPVLFDCDLTAGAGAAYCVSLVRHVFRVGQRAARPFPERRPAKFRRAASLCGPRSPTRAIALLVGNPPNWIQQQFNSKSGIVRAVFGIRFASSRALFR